MIRVLILMACAFMSTASLAAQKFNVEDGDQVKIVISAQDVSRLAVAGEGRLKKVWSPQGYLDLQADKQQGEAFFKAALGAPTSFSFFARDDFGNTFTIVATQQNVPSQTILLVPQNRKTGNPQEKDRHTALPYKKSVNALFKAMFLKEAIRGYTVTEEDSEVPVWAETEIRLVKSYTGNKYQGDVYELINVSAEELTFHETEFFDFGKNVIAAGLEHLKVPANRKTRVYVVRSINKGDK